MIIDSLTHVTKDGRWFETGFDASLKRLLVTMDQAGVGRALLVGLPDSGNNELVLDGFNKYPDRLVPVLGLERYGNEHKLKEELARARLKGFRGIKIHPRLAGVPLGDPWISNTIREAHAHRLFTLLCTVQRPPNPPLGRPVHDVIHEICDKNPDASIAFMHGGYCDLLATSEVLRNYEQTLLDLSYTLPRFHESSIGQDILFLMKTFDRRICIGSDFPEYDMVQVNSILEEKYWPVVPEEKIGNIKLNNLDRFVHRYG